MIRRSLDRSKERRSILKLIEDRMDTREYRRKYQKAYRILTEGARTDQEEDLIKALREARRLINAI